MNTAASPTDLLAQALGAVVAGFDLTRPHVVGGDQVEGDPAGHRQRVHDPATTAPLYDYLPASKAMVDHAVTVGGSAQRAWTALPPAERARRMSRFADLLTTHAEALAEAESRTVGKPIRETRVEVTLAADVIRYFAGWADKHSGVVPPTRNDLVNHVARQPLGTLGLITPWNAPVLTAGANLGPMLAAGNAVVVKPSEFTPVTTALIAILSVRAGLPAGLVNVVAGPADPTGEALVGHGNVAKVTFIGSRDTGHRVAAAAAGRGADTVLELGGKSAQIIFADADLDVAVRSVATGIFGSAGQSCTAGSRLLVHEQIADEVVERLRVATAAIRPGPPTDEETTLGPLVNAGHLERVQGFLSRARQEGGEVVAGGGRPPAAGCGRGYYLEPTIVLCRPSQELAREEVFGPVLSVLRFRDEQEAIALANDSPYDLAGAVWTSDVNRAFRVAKAVRAGVFWINCYKALHPGSPFGGARGSGYGRSSGQDAMDEYTQTKSILLTVYPGEPA